MQRQLWLQVVHLPVIRQVTKTRYQCYLKLSLYVGDYFLTWDKPEKLKKGVLIIMALKLVILQDLANLTAF